jgi:hypothetical protein
MPDDRKRERPVSRPGWFEVFESDEDSHLTPEQRAWPRANPGTAGGEAVPVLEVRLPEPAGGFAAGADRVEPLATALDTFERLLGGAGFARLGRRPRKPGSDEVVILYPRTADGATERLTRLAGVIAALGLGSARVA